MADLLLQGTMRRYAGHYQEIFEDNRRLMEFLHEIDSPIPKPLRVAADMTLTRRLSTSPGPRATASWDLEAAEAELEESAALARRLGARLHNRAIRREIGKLLTQNLEELPGGQAAGRPAAMLARLVGLARRLGMELDLWAAQNQLWAWAGA